ncbi:MAG: HDOD domain-containing protein [Chitinispirillales bacterium]|jgi:putative nucleotidyltransferase with HDIG domain|nr:HDOD domain-containing protein [Chitinispirillales bacterium]
MQQNKMRDDIWQRLQSVKNLQTQPAMVAKITQMLQNPATNASELGEFIKSDPMLASTVLRLVNSAFYGLPGRVGSINHALVLLGFSTVKNIVLSASMLEMFKVDTGSSKFCATELYKHSLACGVIAQYLAQTTGYEQKEECFVAGLVHDIGKMIILQVLPEEFKHVIECADKTKILFYDSERKLLSVSHQEVGGMLVEQWHLPPQIQDAVSSHHNPSPDSKLTAIVHCADVFARVLGYGNGGDDKIPEISDIAWNMLKLGNVNLANMFDDIEKEWQKANAYF